MNKKELIRKIFSSILLCCFFMILLILNIKFPPSDSSTKEKENASPFLSTKADTAENNFSFVYYGDYYRYSITDEKKEIFSFKTDKNTYTDVLNGAGNFIIRDTSKQVIGDFSRITSYQVLASDKLIVYYETSTGKASNLYTFYKNHVEITSSLEQFHTDSLIGTSYLERNFLSPYTDCQKKVSSQWIYPENNDFPYRDFESMVTIHSFDNNRKLYTFLYGDNANPKEPFYYYPEEDLPLYVQNQALSSYQLHFSLVFEDLSVDKNNDSLALFKGKNAPIAVKISKITENGNNSTVFTENHLQFLLNLTNISETSASYTVNYKIYDYYGNICAKEELSGDLLSIHTFEHKIDFYGKNYGIYYLDLEVKSKDYQYQELYPFAILSNYTYRYQDNNPFGVSGIRFGEYEPNDDTIALFQVLGIANARVCVSTPDYIGKDYHLLKTYLEKLYQQKVGLTAQYLLDDWVIPEDTSIYAQSLADILSYISPYLENCEIGNENNNYENFSSLQEAMDYYMNYQFLPTFNVVKNLYHLPIMGSGVFLSKTDWLELSVHSNLWNMTDAFSTHAFSFPYSPDYTDDPAIEHSFESAMVRIRNFLNTYGDKKWYLSELGLPTTPTSATGMFSGADLRTQADYSIREFILALSYGADVIEIYSMYDQTNTLKDYSSADCEYHFGMFYDQDYYGRIMPKPLAAAFGNMTRILESVSSCEEISLSSETLRAFQLKLSANSSPVTVIWSNIFPLTNDCVDGYRTPNLPWNNQWKGSETISLSTQEASVQVLDIMGNETFLSAINGKIEIPVNGSPIFIKGNITITEH